MAKLLMIVSKRARTIRLADGSDHHPTGYRAVRGPEAP